MAISYRKLWKLLIDIDLKKTDLISKVGLSSSTVAKLSQNKVVRTDVIDRICVQLNCDVNDIMEIEHVDERNDSKMDNLSQRKHTVVSLFSGCGGLDMGFLGGFSFLGKEYANQPFDIVWANEMNKAACATYRKNVDSRVVEGKIEDLFYTLPETADIVIGGFPCQDISINGKMAGIEGERSGLYIWMVRAVEKLNPKVFVAENVKALLMKRHEDSLKKVISDFSELGYEVSYHLYDASDYGVPQTRERVIIVGTRKDLGISFTPPIPITREHKITAKEALRDFENIGEDETINHIWSAAKPSSGQGSRYLIADAPATTMRSECHGNLQFHYELPRRISMREAARIQSFPDDFIFCAKLRETERMIGNAVPPVFAWHIATQISKMLNQVGEGD